MLFLNEVLSQGEAHPISEQLYYIRCQLALVRPETLAIAEADARYLLEQFPGLDEIGNVYRLLAYAALKRESPQYRVAADFLLSLRESGVSAGDLAGLNRMIGDCYFLNGDFQNAVDFYRAAKAAALAQSDLKGLFLRLVVAETRSGRIEEALELIDEADFGGRIEVGERWRAEWNIARALQAKGEVQLALERVTLLIGDGEGRAVPSALDLRLGWLRAHLSLESGQADGLVEMLDRLLKRLTVLPAGSIESVESERLEAELRLLQARAFLRVGRVEEGLGAFELSVSGILSRRPRRGRIFRRRRIMRQWAIMLRGRLLCWALSNLTR